VFLRKKKGGGTDCTPGQLSLLRLSKKGQATFGNFMWKCLGISQKRCIHRECYSWELNRPYLKKKKKQSGPTKETVWLRKRGSAAPEKGKKTSEKQSSGKKVKKKTPSTPEEMPSGG